MTPELVDRHTKKLRALCQQFDDLNALLDAAIAQAERENRLPSRRKNPTP